MKKFIAYIKGLLSSETGSPSTMRFVTLFSVLNIFIVWDVANIMAWVHGHTGVQEFSNTAVGIVLTVISGKVAQSHIETRNTTTTKVDETV